MRRREFIKAGLGVVLGLVCPLAAGASEKKLREIWRFVPDGRGATRVRLIAIRKGDRFMSISENEPAQTWIAYTDARYRDDGEPMVEVVTREADKYDKSFEHIWRYAHRT